MADYIFPESFLSKYGDIEILGEGGFGIVFKCTKISDGIVYAVKIVNFTSGVNDEKVKRESIILASLDHPRIIKYYEDWIEGTPFNFPTSESETETEPDNSDSSLYLRMEFCPRTLVDILDAGDIGIDRKISWIKQILEGLNYIHGKGIIHGDLSRGNIFLDAEENIKIGDFGLARKGLGTVNIGSDSGGTYLYSAPERTERHEMDSKADIYSMGILVFELFHPMGGTQSERFQLIKGVREHTYPDGWKHKGVTRFIESLISEDPSDRPSAGYISEKMGGLVDPDDVIDLLSKWL